MTGKLRLIEWRTLNTLCFSRRRFVSTSEVHGTGRATLKALLDRGLVELVRGDAGDEAWRITQEGWRAIYPAAAFPHDDEVVAATGSDPLSPRRVLEPA